MKKMLLTLGMALALTSLFSCGYEGENSYSLSDEDSTVGMPALKLFKEKSSCGLGVDVEMKVNGQTISGVKISNFVDEICEIRLPVNERFYTLNKPTESCGSFYYTGELATENGTSKVRFIDHSDRYCKDLTPGTFELHETTAAGTVNTFYGYW